MNCKNNRIKVRKNVLMTQIVWKRNTWSGAESGLRIALPASENCAN
jgi:hypothetical protein